MDRRTVQWNYCATGNRSAPFVYYKQSTVVRRRQGMQGFVPPRAILCSFLTTTILLSPSFFVSIVNVSAAGKPIRSETAGPYSCAAGSEVYGIVHFLPAASQTVAVELVQSGGQRRHFSLQPEIPL